MSVAGGAVVPPTMDLVFDLTGQIGAMVVLLIAFGYLLCIAFRMQNRICRIKSLI